MNVTIKLKPELQTNRWRGDMVTMATQLQSPKAKSENMTIYIYAFYKVISVDMAL